MEEEGKGIVKEVIHNCISSLDVRIPDCCNCFYQNGKNMMHNLGNRHNSTTNITAVTSLYRLKSCCHHSLSNLCAYTDVAWRKLKKYCCHKDIASYPGTCIISLISLSVGLVTSVNKSTVISKEIAKEGRGEDTSK